MAELKLTVGALTATRTATNENATRLIQSALKQAGYDITGMTGNQQAQAAVGLLVGYLQELAKAHEVSSAVDVARVTAIGDAVEFD